MQRSQTNKFTRIDICKGNMNAATTVHSAKESDNLKGESVHNEELLVRIKHAFIYLEAGSVLSVRLSSNSFLPVYLQIAVNLMPSVSVIIVTFLFLFNFCCCCYFRILQRLTSF